MTLFFFLAAIRPARGAAGSDEVLPSSPGKKFVMRCWAGIVKGEEREKKGEKEKKEKKKGGGEERAREVFGK